MRTNRRKPSHAERVAKKLGCIVRMHDAGKLVVPGSESLCFLKLRVPKRTAWRLKPRMQSLVLPEESYCDEVMWDIDTEATEEWDEYRAVSECFAEFMYRQFDSEGESTNEHIVEIATRELDHEIGFKDSGIVEHVFAVRWKGPFKKIRFGGVQIVQSHSIRLRDFERAIEAWTGDETELSPDQLVELDAKTLHSEMLGFEQPSMLRPFTPVSEHEAKIEWIIEGLLEVGGMTVTFAPTKYGKTALVMAELWKAAQSGQCNVLYLAFEGRNGLAARKAALIDHYGDCPGFAIEPVTGWDLSRPEEWKKVAELTEKMQSHFKFYNDAPLVVVFDTISAALGTGSRIAGDPETFLGCAKRLQQATGVAIWLINHGHERGGDMYGSKIFHFDADTVTKITRSKNGSGLIHTRTLGRHAECGKRLRVFKLKEVGESIVAVLGDDAPKRRLDCSSAEIPAGCSTAMDALEVLGLDEGMSSRELNEALTHVVAKNGSQSSEAMRKRVQRLRNGLVAKKMIVKHDGRYWSCN